MEETRIPSSIQQQQNTPNLTQTESITQNRAEQIFHPASGQQISEYLADDGKPPLNTEVKLVEYGLEETRIPSSIQQQQDTPNPTQMENVIQERIEQPPLPGNSRYNSYPINDYRNPKEQSIRIINEKPIPNSIISLQQEILSNDMEKMPNYEIAPQAESQANILGPKLNIIRNTTNRASAEVKLVEYGLEETRISSSIQRQQNIPKPTQMESITQNKTEQIFHPASGQQISEHLADDRKSSPKQNVREIHNERLNPQLSILGKNKNDLATSYNENKPPNTEFKMLHQDNNTHDINEPLQINRTQQKAVEQMENTISSRNAIFNESQLPIFRTNIESTMPNLTFEPSNFPVEGEAQMTTSASELPDRISMYIDSAATSDGPNSISIQLEPNHLGKIKFKVSLKDHKISAILGVDRPETKEIIELQLPAIRESLAQHGIEVTELSVSLENNSSESNFRHSGLSRNNTESHGSSTSDPEEENRDTKNRDDIEQRYIAKEALVDLLI